MLLGVLGRSIRKYVRVIPVILSEQMFVVKPFSQDYPKLPLHTQPFPKLFMLTIHKAAPDGNIMTSYPAWLLNEGNPFLVVARWTRPSLTTPYVTFAQGDLIFEIFYLDRPYNIFELYAGDGIVEDLSERIAHCRRPMPQAAFTAILDHWRGALGLQARLKGHYVNLAYPAAFDASTRTLTWRDLALDLWAPAAGAPLVLDEEEYLALGIAESDPTLHELIQQTVSQLLEQASQHTGPFAR